MAATEANTRKWAYAQTMTARTARGLEFLPGNRWAYSNYVLLGVVIEKVTGQSYYDYVDATFGSSGGPTATMTPSGR
jgi:D-alanyl-D-alanine carboxypeptidase